MTLNLPSPDLVYSRENEAQARASLEREDIRNLKRGDLDTLTADVATGGKWIAAGGTADAITATYFPAVTVLTDGMLLSFRALGANTIAAPTFAPSGLTARTIVKAGGQALVVGDIPRAAYECLLRYNLANTRWEYLNPYEYAEGTFVPTDGSGASLVFTGVSGRYTRKGRSVEIEIVLTYPSTVNGNNAVIASLPYANNATVYTWVCCRDNASTTVRAVTNTGASTLSLANSAGTPITNAQMSLAPLIASFSYTI